jgi:ABC-type Mn2+/Zn2+ transport system permease subunit
MFTELFMLRAFAAAALLGPVCAFLGVFVTARKMSFFSDTIAHGALAGVALGVWLGFMDLTIPMVLFSLCIAGALVWIQEHTDLLTDTIMALLLSGSVALGVIILSILPGGQNRIISYLFGDILAIGNSEILFAALLFAVVFTGLFCKLSQITLLSAHEELAWVCGYPVRLMNYVFIIALTVTVALSIRLLGIILVTALIVVPPASARNLSRNLRQQIILSIVLGLFGGVLGIIFSYQFNAPCGPSIVLTCILFFVLTLAAGRLLNVPRTAQRHEPV